MEEPSSSLEPRESRILRDRSSSRPLPATRTQKQEKELPVRDSASELGFSEGWARGSSTDRQQFPLSSSYSHESCSECSIIPHPSQADSKAWFYLFYAHNIQCVQNYLLPEFVPVSQKKIVSVRSMSLSVGFSK